MTTRRASPAEQAHCDILFIASGSAEHVRIALLSLCNSYPHATFDVIGRHEAINAIGEFDGCRVIHVTGTAQRRLDLVRRLRQTGYATVAFVEAGSGGFVALQVLPLILGIPKVILADEHGQTHAILPFSNRSIVRHFATRLSNLHDVLVRHAFSAMLYQFCRRLQKASTISTYSNELTDSKPLYMCFFKSKYEYHSQLQASEGMHDQTTRPWQLDLIRRWDFVRHSSSINGHCSICGHNALFTVSLEWGGMYTFQNVPNPNWREQVNCTHCGLNQRFRASILLIKSLVPNNYSRIWLAEQVTPVYKILKALYPNLIGSEYSPTVSAATSVHGLRTLHQDITNTTFQGQVFELVCSFDVMEHVPDYQAAIREAYRTLASGGYFLWSAPMDLSSEATIIRASVGADATVIHHLPPEYHGDPFGSDGSLCYQYFGWDILETLQSVGFADCSVISVASDAECISPQYFALARRP